jgi:hypothetical protein
LRLDALRLASKKEVLCRNRYTSKCMSAQACSASLFHEYESLLNDNEAFECALEVAAHAAGASGHGAAASSEKAAAIRDKAEASGTVRLHGLFVLIDVAVEMLAEAGLHHLLGVYRGVCRHASARFERCMLWQTCHLSGASVRGCLKLCDGVYVHLRHEKWVISLWLCLHLRELERGRETVPAEHVAIYRAATRCVLRQLEGAHAHVVSHLKKNNVFACASRDARA